MNAHEIIDLLDWVVLTPDTCSEMHRLPGDELFEVARYERGEVATC
jgi:hypothetical protein